MLIRHGRAWLRPKVKTWMPAGAGHDDGGTGERDGSPVDGTGPAISPEMVSYHSHIRRPP